MPLSSADITNQIMQGGYRGMGGVNNIGRSGVDFSAYPYARGPQVTEAPNVPIRPLTAAGTAAPNPADITANNPFAAGNWTVADAVGPGYGAELQRLGLMPANLTYNPETRTWT